MTVTETATRPPHAPARNQAEPKRRRKPLSDNLAGYLFLTPWLIGVAVFVTGPTLASLYLSFTNFNLLSPPKWVGLQNYIQLFTVDPRYIHSIEVTLIYVVASVPLSLAAALVLALLLNTKIRGVGIYRSIYYVPSLLGGSVAIAILWRQVFDSNGIFSHFLQLFGIPATSWISTPGLSIWTLIFLHVWQFGSPMVIFLAGLKQIPTELYEAAAVDGASKWMQFRNITLPLLTPIVFFNLILTMINAFQAFTPAYVVSSGTGGPLDSTLFYTLYLYINGFTNFRMGYASAMGWVLLIVVAAFAAAAFATSRYWVYYEDSED